jgi:predicted lipoprotein with Yx(FWY)xxD motif
MSKPRSPRAFLRNRVLLAALVLVALGATALAANASGSATLTVAGTSNSHLDETVVVSPSGFTLYALSPETTRHLLCKSRECLQFWPPLTVRSRNVKLRDGSGVHGALGILRRSNGELQVTLRGMPLYRYAGDHAPHEANGQGLHSFGGTWHAVTATAASTPTNDSSTPSTPAWTETNSTSSTPASSTPTPTTSTPTTPSGGSGGW